MQTEHNNKCLPPCVHAPGACEQLFYYNKLFQPMGDREDSFETIEHDILHIKDYFHNYKFSYIERATKQYFYEKLREKNFSEEKVAEILSKSKAQLVEVKNVIKEAGNVIKDYSARIFCLENEVCANEEVLATETKRLAQLESEVRDLEEKSKDMLRQVALSRELKEVGDELQELIKEVEIKKQEISAMETHHLREDIDCLKARKEKLVARERRMSRMMAESNVNDLYFWYSKGAELIEKMLGCRVCGYEVQGGKMLMRFCMRGLVVEVVVCDGVFADARVQGGVRPGNFDRIREYAIRIDDVKFFLFAFLFSIEK